MAIITKPIPTALQRRASELPCDGVKRYKVGKKNDLTYSEARAAILAEGTVGPNDRGGSILKRGTAQRLAELNRVYFRVASGFVQTKIREAQAEQEAKTKDASAAPQTAEEIDDGGAVGTEVVGGKLDEHKAQAAAADILPAPVAEQATLPVTLPQPVVDLEVGAKRNIHCAKFATNPVGVLSRNKAGYRCVIDGQEARSRSATKIAELISTALSGAEWSLTA